MISKKFIYKIKNFSLLLAVVILWPLVNCLTLIYRIRNRIGRSILIINNAKIGDMVCITPTFRAIKQKYPDSNLSIIINPKTKGILKNNPFLDEIVAINSNSIIHLLFWGLKNRFSASVVMVPGTLNYVLPFLLCIPVRSMATAPEYGLFYRALAYLCSTKVKRFYPDTLSVKHYLDLLNPLGIFDANLKKEVYYTQSAKKIAEDFLIANGWKNDKLLIGFSVSAGNVMKEWPVDRFIGLAKLIYRKHALIPVFFGANTDRSMIKNAVKALDLEKIPYIIATTFSLEDLPAAMSFLSFFVSVDTGTLYIANALNIPVVDIAGPCNIYDQMPIYEKCEVVYVKDLPGWPYTSVLRTTTKLNREQMRCIVDISTNMVFEAFSKLHAKYGTKRYA